MTLRKAFDIVRQIVAGYFGEGHVFYAESRQAAQTEPYITIKAVGVTRQANASKLVEPDEYQKHFRQVAVRCELNLYTRGRNRNEGIGVPVYENTALNDMIGFQDYLESDFVIEEQDRNDIAIVTVSDPRDLSFLQNNSTAYQYRASMEFEFRYTDVSYGGFGQDGVTDLPSDSGGGSADLITGPYVIDETEIEGGYE